MHVGAAAAGISWVEARAAAEHPATHKAAAHDRELSDAKCQSGQCRSPDPGPGRLQGSRGRAETR